MKYLKLDANYLNDSYEPVASTPPTAHCVNNRRGPIQNPSGLEESSTVSFISLQSLQTRLSVVLMQQPQRIWPSAKNMLMPQTPVNCTGSARLVCHRFSLSDTEKMDLIISTVKSDSHRPAAEPTMVTKKNIPLSRNHCFLPVW